MFFKIQSKNHAVGRSLIKQKKRRNTSVPPLFYILVRLIVNFAFALDNLSGFGIDVV